MNPQVGDECGWWYNALPFAVFKPLFAVNVLAWGALVTTILLWGSAYTCIRIALEHDAYTPSGLALWRYLAASLTLGGVAVFTGLRRPPREDWPKLAALGLIGLTLYHLALNTGQKVVPPGSAALLIAFAPVFSALIATCALGERINLIGWAGIAISLCGEIIITFTTSSDFRFEPSAGWILLAALCTAIYFVGQKPMLKRYRPAELSTWTVWFGTVWLLVLAPVADLGFTGEIRCYSAVLTAPLETTWVVLYLGALPGGVAYLTYNYVLARIPASRATSLLYLMPIVAILIDWGWSNHVPQPVTLLGGLLCIGGVVLVNTWGKGQRGA